MDCLWCYKRVDRIHSNKNWQNESKVIFGRRYCECGYQRISHPDARAVRRDYGAQRKQPVFCVGHFNIQYCYSRFFSGRKHWPISLGQRLSARADYCKAFIIYRWCVARIDVRNGYGPTEYQSWLSQGTPDRWYNSSEDVHQCLLPDRYRWQA